MPKKVQAKKGPALNFVSDTSLVFICWMVTDSKGSPALQALT